MTEPGEVGPGQYRALAIRLHNLISCGVPENVSGAGWGGGQLHMPRYTLAHSATAAATRCIKQSGSGKRK